MGLADKWRNFVSFTTLCKVFCCPASLMADWWVSCMRSVRAISDSHERQIGVVFRIVSPPGFIRHKDPRLLVAFVTDWLQTNVLRNIPTPIWTIWTQRTFEWFSIQMSHYMNVKSRCSRGPEGTAWAFKYLKL